MPAQAHISYAATVQYEEEQAACRWEDDGGHVGHLPPAAPAGHWLRISAALTERLPEIAGRDDVIVTCEVGGTRAGAPAAFYPTQAVIEIDTSVFAPHRPAALQPARHGDEERYPVAWGALVHEASHSAHSKWTTPAALRGTAVDGAAQMLEESRVEYTHLARRPGDRPFLRACVGRLVLADFTAHTPNDPWQAAYAAGLILARRDAGILDADETDPLEETVTAVLGTDLLATLAGIWKAAQVTRDEDGPQMLAHARAWCQALGADPHQPPPAPGPDAQGQGELAEAIGETIGNITAAEAATAAIAAARATRAREKSERAAQEKQAALTATKVFAPSTRRPHAPGTTKHRGKPPKSPITGTRNPTGAEKAAAGQLARALRTAAYRERTATVTASAAPPGRLNMRGALARDAQKAAGATPTAMPWIHTQRRQAPSPPLRVGIAVDISGSMHEAAAPIASAAWILARATALTDPDSSAATVAYDHFLTAITAPGRTPDRVAEFTADGFGHSLAETTDALSAGLGLTQPGRGRLLVIASDGYYAPDEAARAADRIKTLTRTGCAVLWLAFAPDPRPLPGTTLLELADLARATAAIAQAATAAIATTR
ncbi:hypothetical protein [Streptomyces sp. MZ04]|uniref:VWA domain-containing protein n=1 Tax=Streptomyces sp. MZ04 TaxID=2559236 RepID=UPI00107EB689|nr:hypothetical protein [Streptomyces sp. MZ04]TGB00867.1 hypothetical protein E2651_28195 [Streptomyces sp. MZ04]